MTTIDLNTYPAGRYQAHKAAQLLHGFNVANVPPQPNGEHTALIWDRSQECLVTHAIDLNGKSLNLALDFAAFELLVQSDGETTNRLALAGREYSAVLAELDEVLVGLGAQKSGTQGYQLADGVLAISVFDDLASHEAARLGLKARFQFAATSLEMVSRELGTDPSVRILCWPHHFDLAMYVPLGVEVDGEPAGVGIGFAPGETGNDFPYFYMNLWPLKDASALGTLPEPFQVETAGFQGTYANWTNEPQDTARFATAAASNFRALEKHLKS